MELSNRIKMKEPFWGHWNICEDGLLGQGSFGAVYRIQRQEFDTVQYAALKVISIPQNQSEVEQFLSMGMNRQQIQEYYYEMVKEIYGEIDLMAKMKGKSNIISYEDHEIFERTDDYGFDLFIRMELAESLTKYGKKHILNYSDVIELGKDMCNALIACEKRRILHRDIKPDNIFVSADGDYKLGDFGIARTLQGTVSGMSIKGSYSYMAPEVYKGRSYDHRADIYSLGIVLYVYLNGGTLPFIEGTGGKVTYSGSQNAFLRRMSGEKISLPMSIPENFRRVVERAIAYDPEERYASAKEFYDAICSLSATENVSVSERTVQLQLEPSQPVRTANNNTVILNFETGENTGNTGNISNETVELNVSGNSFNGNNSMPVDAYANPVFQSSNVEYVNQPFSTSNVEYAYFSQSMGNQANNNQFINTNVTFEPQQNDNRKKGVWIIVIALIIILSLFGVMGWIVISTSNNDQEVPEKPEETKIESTVEPTEAVVATEEPVTEEPTIQPIKKHKKTPAPTKAPTKKPTPTKRPRKTPGESDSVIVKPTDDGSVVIGARNR
ncbi:MAG: protein kinase [Lachnospiraceae bacterium]|nr:protein kinase [Lachnospiraceae bacterium]